MSGEIVIHDTRSGELQALKGPGEGTLGIYACGPTVYGRIHIGNARPFVVFSLLRRLLVHERYEVRLVVNITDVNDKIYDAAVAAGEPSAALAERMIDAYRADTDALGLGRPDAEPLASETMDAIIDYISALVDRDHAYAVDGDVYFRVRSDEQYGSLSHRRIEDMDQGEGVEGVERKQDPLDFALWKGRKEGEDTWWDSPWGSGRPGWHIECSAMAEQLLGDDFEIHGGGSDLLFPHHENEASQTRAARGHELARLWMHNGMVQMTGEKMAKSAGNIAPLHEVLANHDAPVVVMYLISGHYRQPLAFSEAQLEDAARRLRRVREALRRLLPGEPGPADMAAYKQEFFAALRNDFNTPAALAAMDGWIREANRRAEGVGDGDLREMLGVLGLGGLTALQSADAAGEDPEAMALLAQRERARSERDFTAADRFRDQLRERGWEVRDGPDGPELIRA